MTPFAIVVAWDERDVTQEEVSLLLRPVLPRCSDGTTALSVPGAAAAIGLRAVVPGENLEAGLLVDKERRRLIVGDLRLDGRSDLIGALGAGTLNDPDIRLVALAIDRFGEDAPAHLVGDFAFVVWDWGARILWAARDRFGLRSLHFRTRQGGISFASDVRQLLVDPQDASVDRSVDSEMILNYLLNTRGHRSRTYFGHVKQVRPGHRANANQVRLEQTRYWWPPRHLIEKASHEDYVDEWRRLLLAAVRDRLRSAYPIAAHLSGGLDSGAITGGAHELYERAGATEGQPLVTLSALFPGLACDETEFIGAARRRMPLFESASWNGRERDSSDFDRPLIASPGLTRGPRIGPWKDIEAAHARGARVLLIGEGGDEVGWSRGVFRDMVSAGKLVTFARELGALGSWRLRKRCLLEGLRGLVPWSLEDAFDPRAPISGPAPYWMGPELMKIFPGAPDEAPEPCGFSSNSQRELWRLFSSPRAYSALELLGPVAADAGIELRTPFLDSRLVNFVLAIPWTFRLPRGDLRRLGRDGVRAFVPPMVANRLVKPVFADAIYNQIRVNLPRIRNIIHDCRWVSGAFVRQSGAQQQLAACLSRDPAVSSWRPWRQVWKLAAFEAWLRTLLAYSGA